MFYSNIKKIFSSYDPQRAWALFWNYIKIIILNRLPKIKNSNFVNFLGFRIEFPYRPAFFGLITEIFFQPFYNLKPSVEKLKIFDCGSNIGIRTLYFKWLYPNASFTCFEPNPTVLKYLEENITSNHIENVEIHSVALGAQEGMITLYRGDGVRGSGSSSVIQSGTLKNENSVSVPVKKLSDYIEGVVDIVKLDVEGVEGDILEDLSKSGKLKNIRSFIIEYHFDGSTLKYPLSHIEDILTQDGFHITKTPLEAYNTKVEPVLYTCMIYATR